jgi:hypothetical protein
MCVRPTPWPSFVQYFKIAAVIDGDAVEAFGGPKQVIAVMAGEPGVE